MKQIPDYKPRMLTLLRCMVLITALCAMTLRISASTDENAAPQRAASIGEGYNPPSPPDPPAPAVTHRVSISVSPAAGGSATSSFEMPEGSSRYIYAYPNTGFKVESWIVNGETIESESTSYEITMRTRPIDITINFKYSPESPANPGANFFDPASGLLIIDDFTPGNLYNAVWNTVNNLNQVTGIIVKGVMKSSDLGAFGYLPNVATIDFSRTSGIETVNGWSFPNSAQSVILPYTITKISDYAFGYDTSALTSLTCYAMEPPKCSSSSFYGLDKNQVTVFVPAGALALYTDAEYWKDFTILPISADSHTLRVNLPSEAADGRYKNNSLEIVNVRTDVRQKYVISDRMQYTFNGLQKDESYNVFMYSQTGLEIGRMEYVIIPDHDLDITFDNLKSLHTVSANVYDAEGNDVTPQVTVEWLRPLADGTMTYLRKAESLGEIPEGQPLVCRISLDSSLGVIYANPEDKEFTVGPDNNACKINLEPFRGINLSGTVVDPDGLALSGASVSVNQTLNGKYSKTYTAKTDRKGLWNLSVLDAPETTITYAAADYINANDTIAAFEYGISALDLGQKAMRSIVGTRLTYEFTYHAAGSDDTQDYYTDHKNVIFSVFNLTQNREHTELSIQYPVLAVIDENINAGDELKVTAISKTGAFNPVEATATVGENQRADVAFDIVGKGGISASFETTDNPTVIAMLYSPEGEFLKKQTYSEAKTTFIDLEDGDYTLVSMGQSDLMNSILRLSSLEEMGLAEGKDYVKNSVNVKSGSLSEIKNSTIPAFDESIFYYTSSNTGFSVNKTSITTGNFLTLRAAIDFKDAYTPDIKNVALVVDLPDACALVEQSVIQGPNLLPYTLDNKRLTIQLGKNYQAQTRFCVIPTAGGSFNATASIVFDYNGKIITQPIGSASSDIKNLEITVPSVIAGKAFTVSGTAQGNSSVNVYVDGALHGNGKANATGRWNIECELANPYNLSQHNIYAEISTPTGNTFISETKSLTYDINAVQVSKVTMYHFNPELNMTFQSVFDFINPKIAATQWTVYYPNKRFTYTIEFTDNNPERISNVILYVHTADHKIVPVNASFDEHKGLWYAELNMGSSSDGYYPINCSVDFDYNFKPLGDCTVVNESIDDVDSKLTTSEELENLISNFLENNDNLDSNLDLLYEYLGIDQSEPITVPSNIGEFFDEVETILLEEESVFDDEFFNFEDTDGNQLSFICGYQKDIYLSSDELQNFEATELTDGTILYVREVDGLATIYYNNTLVTFGDNDTNQLSKIYNSGGADEFFTKWNQLQATLKALKYLPKAKEIISRLNLDDIIRNLRWKLRTSSYFLTQFYSDNMTEDQLSQFDLLKAKDCVKNLGGKIEALTKLRNILGGFFKAINIAGIINDINIARESREYWNYLIESIEKSDCPGVKDLAAKARKYQNDAAIGYTFNIRVNVASCVGIDKTLASIAALTATAALGRQLSTAKIALWAATISTFINDVVYIQGGTNQILDINRQSEIQNKIPVIKCPKDCGEPGMPPCPGGDGGGNGGGHNSGSPNDNVQIDPSGYVFEAVPENRVEGVQASIYYKETKEDMYGDPYEEIVLWDAEEYAQKNPLFTDENGMYRWDVPQGLWQVKFEKDGYETAYSEWLPVPPPQLEVNIGIVQNKQPEVKEAHAYEEGVEVQFDKYMDPSTLTTDNIYVTANGVKLNGEIRLIDLALADEYASEDDADAIRYASRARFVPAEKISSNTGEVCLTVSRNVLSYAGIPMTETFSQVLDVEKEVQAIYADDVKVLYGGEKEVTVYALPFEAAVGRKLRISSSSGLITSIDKTEAILDAEGKAVVKVKGDLPGRAQLSFTIDDVAAKGECIVDVVTEIITAEAPKASRASGTSVYRGTTVELTTESKNATIYYTTDGSCPCDENGTRRKYTEPIIINEDTHILAMTSVNNGEDISEVVEFNYSLMRSDMDFQMAEGWTWISHNFESNVPAAEFAADANVSRILSQTKELIRDPQIGLTGNLTDLTAAQSYKVETTGATARQRLSDVAWNPATPIALTPGWNWLGYPVAQTMSVDEALAATDAETSDVIVGQNGFAEYDGEKWVGTLETMSPGMGYMYRSQSAKEVVYNTSVISRSRAMHAPGISANSSFVLDIHKYGVIMPVIATLNSSDGLTLDNEDYHVAAFCGSECRGIGRVVNGLVMMNVYGDLHDVITFLVTDADGEISFSNEASLEFSETVIGDLFNPYVIAVNTSSGINGIVCEGKIKVSVAGNMLRIKGIAADDIRLVEIYDTNGRKLIRETDVPKSGIRIDGLKSGVYVVIVNGKGEYSYHKIAIR